MLELNLKQEEQRIVEFLDQTFKSQGISHAAIGISGGIDSATSFSLLQKVLSPSQITAIHLPYHSVPIPTAKLLLDSSDLPTENIHIISIKPTVDKLIEELHIPESDIVRRGNIMARTRMLYLYDFAKKLSAMVVGTENKSEHYLGYFTRFGDAASDIEPIVHLYKTQVRQLAKNLDVPQEILDADPTAGLWEGQTDESEFGFSYQEADEVLCLHFEKNQSLEEIQKEHPYAEKILQHVKNNAFKLTTPYSLLG